MIGNYFVLAGGLPPLRGSVIKTDKYPGLTPGATLCRHFALVERDLMR
jgi:hypothetical protein